MDFDPKKWPSQSPLIEYLLGLCANTLAAYRENSVLVEEHSNLERTLAQGSYGRRQIYELVQNGADALIEQPGGRICVVLTDGYLYCANEGEPIDDEGVTAILHSYLSVKRRNEIGRFGLGFKSVLGVTHRPEFFCRSGSFGFEAEWAAEEIRRVVPSAGRCPTLRLARVLDAAECAEQDPTLRELMSWATTVVRLPRDPTQTAWLAEDVRRFPSEFLLFCSHVGEVTLEDRSTADTTVDVCRTIRIQNTADGFRLGDGQDERTWKVFATTHSPSPEAREEAGELADREELPVILAVPMEGRLGTGRFWAFFPLNDETTLSGIVNAPWKTNDDRTGLLEGRFNDELLDVAAKLAVDNLPDLIRDEDPAWYLDVLPARGREARCWADDQLTRKTYACAVESASLVDQDGVLRLPKNMQLHPDGVPREVLDSWSAQPNRPANWCHPSVETRDRRPRALRLLDLAGGEERSVPEWLTALAQDGEIASFRACIRIAAELHEKAEDDSLRNGIGRAHILVDEAGQRARPIPGRIFLPADHKIASEAILIVHPELASDERTREALETLGIVPVTPELELEALVSGGFARWSDSDWDRLWDLVRRSDATHAGTVLKEARERRDRIKVRTLAGEYIPLGEALMPGPVVPDDGTRDADVAIDTEFHEEEGAVLRAIGAVAVSTVGCGSQQGRVFLEYKNECVKDYYERLPDGSSQPQYDYLVFASAPFAGPLEPLPELSEEGKVRFTTALLGAGTELVSRWRLEHDTRKELYPTREYMSPVLWAVRRHGRLATSLGPRPPEEAVGPTLGEWSQTLPVAECSETAADALELVRDPEQFGPEIWRAALEGLLGADDDHLIGKFYAAAATHDVPAPDSIRCRVGESHSKLPPKGITVVLLPNEFQALISIRMPVILAENRQAQQALVERWCCRPAERSVRTQVACIPIGDPVPLADRFPALRWQLDTKTQGLSLVTCSELRQETLTEHGKTARATDFIREGNTIYWLEKEEGPAALLDRLVDELGLELPPEQRDAILEQRADQERRDRLAEVRRERSDASRLLKAVGEEAIRPRLPEALVHSVEEIHGPLPPEKFAELALIVYGTGVLKEFCEELEQKGLRPPQQWAGSLAARKFVSDLGFPPEYAGQKNARREPVLWVDGPSKLPRLHEYQVDIANRIRELLRAAPDNRRALMSLPTGAGKTRVAVQALIDAVRDGEAVSPILWVAQTDELCEQAVQTWREVWRTVGSSCQLKISRLWARNEADEADGLPQVVVATIQKLRGCIEDDAYKWLSKAAVLVIDEAHGATTPSYTGLLEWTGIGRAKTRCPLIGLTATPFRGRSEEQTKRLAGRFGRTRLDEDLGEDPYRFLQDLRVLSRVEHHLLPGVRVRLSPTELAELTKLRSIPASVYDRLAGDAERNKMLMRDIAERPRDWPILLFAASVEHAQTMAALLSLQNITAAPISAETPSAVRRRCIEGFKSGEIQVLTNYGVLAQGFDAPATRAIYVTRPTFSPNIYQQMIGRGLRGPLNGGKEECLIVNVEDTFAQFGEQLAFREFEYLWSRDGG